MDQVHRLLEESIFCYRRLMKVYEHLREKISSGGSSEKLSALLDQSRELSKMVQYVDQQFHKLAYDHQVAIEDLPLFPEWKALLRQVNEENRLMRRQLRSNHAMVKDDIRKIRRTQVAIHGLTGPKSKKNKQMNRIFP